MIRRVIVKNYKGLQNADIEFRPGINILVGDNETGKSTILEAINLALTGQLNRRAAAYELHPFLFHQAATKAFVANVQMGEPFTPPEILIEAYLTDDAPADFRGTNNSRNEDCRGVYLKLILDDACAEEYATFISDKERASLIPTEYYRVVWQSFAQDDMHLRSTPIKPVLIDPGAIRNNYAANRYVVDVARDYLSAKQQADVSLAYRHMRRLFQDDANIQAINEKLKAESSGVSDRTLSVGLDMTAKANWDSSVLPHLDELPLNQIGKGEQNSIKIKLALKASADYPVVLLEEPENHLSHTNLNRLIDHLAGQIGDRQLIVTTHSSFVLNKLDVGRTLLFNGSTALHMGELSKNTRDYFLRLPGHDTLRMVLATRTILVEGPSDELVVQRAYRQAHGRLPLDDGVEVISVNSLAFKRFLEIAAALNLPVAVVTDNDGAPDKVTAKYKDYAEEQNIRICFSPEATLPTLEPHLLASNGLATISALLGMEFADEGSALDYMTKNKAAVALRLFEAPDGLQIPEYIQNAVA